MITSGSLKDGFFTGVSSSEMMMGPLVRADEADVATDGIPALRIGRTWAAAMMGRRVIEI